MTAKIDSFETAEANDAAAFAVAVNALKMRIQFILCLQFQTALRTLDRLFQALVFGSGSKHVDEVHADPSCHDLLVKGHVTNVLTFTIKVSKTQNTLF